MNSIKAYFPLFVLLPQFLIGFVPLNILAQQPQENPRKEHLQYCVQQLPMTVGQLEAIKSVMQQENLTTVQKVESVSQILTPQQKQQLRQCMQQPMPQQQQPSPQQM